MMSTVMVAFLGGSYLVHHRNHHLMGLISSQPIYDPRTFSVRAIAAGTAVAATTFIGFDGVSILAEEVENPRRNVLLASVLVCVFTGVFAALQVYLAVRVWPDYRTFVNPETAFMDVAGLWAATKCLPDLARCCSFPAWRPAWRGCRGRTFALQYGARQLLPRKIFGHLDARRGNPSYNVLIAGGWRIWAVHHGMGAVD